MKFVEIKEMANQHLMQNVGRYNLSLVKGEGLKVWDSEGNMYYDFLAGVATCALGHSPKILREALNKQAEKLIHISNFFYSEPLVKLAEFLTLKSGLGKAFFCNSGTEANEAAIKLARKYSFNKYGSGRYEIITAENSFHGRTLGAVSATGQAKVKEGFFPLLPGFEHVPFANAEAILKAIKPETCAIMLEPVQGEGGVIVPPKEYFIEVAKICKKFDLLLILDEVQTGLGRTGKAFAFQHYEDLKPDIVSLAKALGGGLPVGAILAKNEVAEAFTPGSHSTTVGGSPLIMATCLEFCKYILEDNFLAEVNKVGQYFQNHLIELKNKLTKEIVEVRGVGLLLGLKLSFPAAPVVLEMMKRGFIINVTAESILRFVPPLNVTKAEIDLLIPVLEEAIKESFKG